MKAYRLSRLFPPPARCGLHVALESLSRDTALPGQTEHFIASVAEAAPEALQLSIGQADLLQALAIHPRPALVLRADVNNLRAPAHSRVLFSRIIENAVEQALRLDAAGVLASLLYLPGEPALTAQCVANIQRLAPLCERWCMPLVVDLVVPPSVGAGPASQSLAALVREVCELGADVVKIALPEDLAGLSEIVQTAAPALVLVREDRKATDREIFARAAAAMDQGAVGIVAGQCLSRHEHPGEIIRRLATALRRPSCTGAVST